MLSIDNDELVFDTVTNLVKSAGGDGDGVLVVSDKRFLEVVSKFEKWLLAHNTHYNKHMIKPYHILFYEGLNENINIIDKSHADEAKSNWQIEVWIEIH